MDSVAVVLNSTPSYYWILPGTVGLYQRYGKGRLPLFFGTEMPSHPVVEFLKEATSIQIIELDRSEADFFESRLATVKALPPTYHYVLPLQEDFLLERPGPDWNALEEAIQHLQSSSVASVRLMPCPGSSTPPTESSKSWLPLNETDLQMSYQATLWKRDVYERFLEGMIRHMRSVESLQPGTRDYNQFAVQANPAETAPGHALLKTLCPDAIHLCWKRAGPWSNAVYLCPWPYRPTAIVKGSLQPFAKELLEREGFWPLCQRYRTG
jgi:hypothetical protein